MKTYKKFKIAGLLLAAVMLVNTASAALLVEPHLSYNLHGSGDNDGSGASRLEYEYNGPQYGLRVGYQNLGFMAGIDYTRSNFDMDYKSVAPTFTGEMERSEWGVFAGYNFPILVRAWGAYYFSNTTKDKTHHSEMTGNTKELGVGFTGLPFLSVNFIYRMVSLDEEKSNGVTSTIDDSNNEFVIGISLPLTL